MRSLTMKRPTIMAAPIAEKAIGFLAAVAVRSTEWDVNRHNFAR